MKDEWSTGLGSLFSLGLSLGLVRVEDDEGTKAFVEFLIFYRMGAGYVN